MLLANFLLFLVFLVTLGCYGVFLLIVACWAWFRGTWASFMHCSAAVWCFSLLAAAALGASAAAGLVAPCWKFWSLAVACFNKWGERSERAKRECEAF